MASSTDDAKQPATGAGGGGGDDELLVECHNPDGTVTMRAMDDKDRESIHMSMLISYWALHDAATDGITRFRERLATARSTITFLDFEMFKLALRLRQRARLFCREPFSKCVREEGVVHLDYIVAAHGRDTYRAVTLSGDVIVKDVEWFQANAPGVWKSWQALVALAAVVNIREPDDAETPMIGKNCLFFDAPCATEADVRVMDLFLRETRGPVMGPLDALELIANQSIVETIKPPAATGECAPETRLSITTWMKSFANGIALDRAKRYLERDCGGAFTTKRPKPRA